ncbi:MAG: hypothetical protein JWO47_107 [Candidatus Saccharibacteria bacterium]|nr:hypothetical protein [Candidatus Saccharibacteria bacterium]
MDEETAKASEPAVAVKKPARTRKKAHGKLPVILASVFGTLLVLGGGYGAWVFLHRVVSPVPKAIRASVNFPVYYPDQKKLPVGYTLDLHSFKNPHPNTLLYNVTYGNGKKLVFALQVKPSDDDIQSFYANLIPLRNKMDVPAGHAEIGAYNNGGKIDTQSVISLPTATNTWIIITGPGDIDQGQLKQVLTSIRS